MKALDKEETFQTLAGLFGALMELHRRDPDMTLDGLKATLAVAVATADPKQMRLPSVGKVAEELHKSASRASRLLAGLSGPDGYIASQRGIQGDRTDALVLTDRGRELVAALLSALTGKAITDFRPQTFENYVKARWIDQAQDTRLRQVAWDDGTLTLVVTPKEAVESKEIQEWMSEQLSQKPEPEETEKGVALRFATISDAVYFKLRWC